MVQEMKWNNTTYAATITPTHNFSPAYEAEGRELWIVRI